MLKLSKNLIFSSKVVSGSVQNRLKYCDELNNKIFNLTLQKFNKDKGCDIFELRKIYNEAFPESKKINITPLPKEDEEFSCGITGYKSNRQGIISNYVLELPMGKNKKFDISLIPTIMHESAHLLEYLSIPKFIALEQKLTSKNLYDVELKPGYGFIDFYEDNFYDPADKFSKKDQKILKNRTLSTIKSFSSDVKILFLKLLKYAMVQEQYAYSQDIKYARILNKMKLKVDPDDLKDYRTCAYYPEKIKIVNEILYDVIKKERSLQKNNIKDA